MPDARTPDARELLLDMLFEQTARYRFPSLSMLDMIESLLEPDEVDLYARLLLRQMQDENYPSLPVLRRIAALTQ
ncbi:hypothetical protein [Kribbella sp. NPDC004536]|uniref:hypothetical protein n=1 Tax=Kribbella sp. NPDC004536 TaxID=3364106 RepID=UPI0036C97040